MRGENYIRVGGLGPITPSPPRTQKLVGGFGPITSSPPPHTQKSVGKPLATAQFIQDFPCSANCDID